MKKILMAIAMATLLAAAGQALALDNFMSYKNFNTSTDEDVAVVPQVNYAIQQGYINSYVLTADTNKTITVPTGAKYAIIAATHDIYVKVGGAAAVPSGDTEDGTGSELNPKVRYLGSETTMGLISESAAKVTIMFYK